jgi:NADH dehydrogenase [ubiquinone] 1 alpha subcomplex assembly factor 2
VIEFILNLFFICLLREFVVTTQELQADLARQQRVKTNVAILEARDKEERAQMERLVAPSHPSETEQSPSASQNVPMSQRVERPASDQQPEPQTRDPWAEATKRSDEPRSWTPVTRRR